jgi:hypothetical protein
MRPHQGRSVVMFIIAGFAPDAIKCVPAGDKTYDADKSVRVPSAAEFDDDLGGFGTDCLCDADVFAL